VPWRDGLVRVSELGDDRRKRRNERDMAGPVLFLPLAKVYYDCHLV
jgi:hypothetical protein